MTQRKIGSGGIGDNIEFAGNYIQLPAGTTAERPVSPENGQMRFNTTLGKLEQYNVNGWQAIDTPPIVSTLSYSGGLLAADPVGGETITVTGSNFTSSVTVTIDGTLAPTVSVVDANNITFTTPAKTAGDYDVTVTNNTGLGATLTGGISYNGTPSFSTAAGKIGNDLPPGSAIQTITIVAAEPDGGALAYSVTSGALPSGLSLASDGDITGTTPSPSTTTTYNFTVAATDDENQTNSRAFNLVVLRPVYAYSIAQSLMFNDDDSQYLSWTPASAGNRKTWTWSGWVKRGNVGSSSIYLFAAKNPSAGTRDNIRFASDDLDIYFNDFSNGRLTTNQVFRDPSAWYHIVVAVDTTQATSSNRVKLYVNGEQVTSFSTSTYPAQNYDTFVAASTIHNIGGNPVTLGNNTWDGYLTEVNFIDGTALTPTSFGESYNDVWVPKEYTGSYGTNGFHLDFQYNGDNSFYDATGIHTSSTVGSNLSHTNAESKWGNSSLSVGSTDKTYQITGSNGILFPSSSNNRTFECWVYYEPSGGSTNNIVLFYSYTSDYYNPFIFIDGGNQSVRVGNQSNGGSNLYYLNSSTPVSSGWNHVAVTYENRTGTIFLNGNQVGQYTWSSGTFGDPGTLEIFRGGSHDRFPYVDDVRISSGLRYTGSTYTVPTSAFEVDGDTLFLMRSDYLISESIGADASGNNNHFTPNNIRGLLQHVTDTPTE